MNYKNAVDYINSFINFEKIPQYQYASSFKLERMYAILEELGNPHKDLNVIHVAGSKGKGSTCAITAYILKEAGYRVGLYTSPHLVDFRERIRVLYQKTSLDFARDRENRRQKTEVFEGMISEEEFVKLIDEIRLIAEKFREHKTLGKASFFEILTACAFLYFKKTQTDAVVLETGLGGRLDATNVAMPLICGITNLSLEHTDKLGSSLEKIAYEKAGIIKKQRTEDRGQRTPLDFARGREGRRQGLVVSAAQEKEAVEVIRKVCEKINARLYEIGKDIKYSIKSSDEKKQVFDIEGPGYFYKDLELSLIGMHQVENASLSMGMLKLVDKLKITESYIREGLKNAVWPGRLQIIQRNPYVILDGAQNPASIWTLISSVKRLFKYKRLLCIFGVSSDKDIKGMSGLLGAFSDIIILTKAKDNPRSVDSSNLRQNFQSSPRCEARPGLEESNNIDEALQKAFQLADKDDMVLVTGSLFVVGDAMKSLSPT